MNGNVTALLLLLLSGAAAGDQHPARRDHANPVVSWNEHLLQVAENEDGFLTLKGVRSAAMMHLAMDYALSELSGQSDWPVSEDAIRSGTQLDAVIQAAYVVAIDQYPDRRKLFDDLRAQWLPDHSESTAGSVGVRAARTILQQRINDGWDNAPEYHWHPMAPGVYAEFNEHSNTPKGFIFGAGWGAVRPFVLLTPDQFRSPPPPDIQSSDYTNAFNEVKRVGRFESKNRTADQTHLALWWKDFAENSHNRLARDLAVKEQLSLRRSAHLFALLNVSIFDAYVSVFNNKFYYNHWRPYTAIHWADKDGNSDTIAEKSWTNTHRHTYAFPSYPSAHGTACAAAMVVMADTFGEDYAFVMRTLTVDSAGPFSGKMSMEPATREFSSFSSAANECAMSRLYLGIHFRYDSEAGNQLGEEIGSFVTTRMRQ